MMANIDPVQVINLSPEERLTLLIEVLKAYNELTVMYDELLYKFCEAKLQLMTTEEDKPCQ